MAANMKDVRKFYTMIKANTYPKNGSWKDAPVMKNAISSFVIVMLQIIALAGVYDYWG